jgi:glutamine synthetase
VLLTQPIKVEHRENVIASFNKDVFSRTVLRSYLTDVYYKEFLDCLENYKELSPELADMIAHAMKEWAFAKGATHFTHWFQPMTGTTAEKHDSFLDWSGQEQQFMPKFTGKRLIKGESDASSFPSGGVRQTFEARGYTIWDLSPAFIKHGVNGSTLYIPTAFASWKGDALDAKTPLLRSEKVLSDNSVRLIKLINPDARVHSTQSEVGPEQEFFLIDRQHFLQRPDLLHAGRTVVGSKPVQEQQHGYHYFGTTPPRVLAFMQDAEVVLSKLGIPMLARHNEVAPGQFEMAPIFERSPVAADHNMLLMDTLQTVANRHGLECLLHEKPFARVNGSGKHLNYSISTNFGENVFVPGGTPEKNWRFIIFLTALIRGVHLHGDLMRAITAVPGNDYRLGSHEAPPAVVSIYLGAELHEVCQFLMGLKSNLDKTQETLKFLGTHLPALKKDKADRNRTSPFAFTGNRFEFRAIGSSQNIAVPITILNAIMADSVKAMADEIEKKIDDLTRANKGASSIDKEVRQHAIEQVVQENLKKHYTVVYNGDNYTDEYLEEAKRRGLPHLRLAPAALAAWDDPKNIDLLTRTGISTKTEQEARSVILRENFLGQLLTEANCQQFIVKTHVIPAAIKYQNELSASLKMAKEAVSGSYEEQETAIAKVRDLIKALYRATEKMDEVLKDEHNFHGDIKKKFAKLHPELTGALKATREFSDQVEEIIADNLWPLPRYSEMLFY